MHEPDDDDCDASIEEVDDPTDEDAIALRAIQALLDVEGDDEVAQAQREALLAVSEAAMALKASRQRREREPARGAEVARRAAELCAEAERERQEQIRRWEAEREQRDAMRARALELTRRDDPPRRIRPQPIVPTRPPAPAKPRRLVPTIPTPASRPTVRTPKDTPFATSARLPTSASRPEPLVPRRSPLAERPADRKVAAPERDGVREEVLPAAADLPMLTGADLVAWRRRLALTQRAAGDRLGVEQGTVSKGRRQAAGDARAGAAPGAGRSAR